MAWRIDFKEQAIKNLKKLDRPVQLELIHYLEGRIAAHSDPCRFGSPLSKDKKGLWRYRVGDYRIICRIELENKRLLVLVVGHRKEVYE